MRLSALLLALLIALAPLGAMAHAHAPCLGAADAHVQHGQATAERATADAGHRTEPPDAVAHAVCPLCVCTPFTATPSPGRESLADIDTTPPPRRTPWPKTLASGPPVPPPRTV